MTLMEPGDYVGALSAWRAQMDADLRRDYGWLTLVGLYWLKEGVNTLGSSPDCDIQLPRRAARLLGVIELKDNRPTLHVDLGQSIDVNGVPARAEVALRSEQEPPASVMTCDDLGMLIVRQGGRLGLRVWDNLRARETPPRAWFEVDEKYRVKGTYDAYPVPVKVRLPTSTGGEEDGYVQGYVSFKLAGKSLRLDAAEMDDGRLYLPFYDQTNGARTYPKGRYLYSETVQEDGQVILDFNRAYTPPSAFQDKEPSTFGPPGNQLKVAVEAGELFTPIPHL